VSASTLTCRRAAAAERSSSPPPSGASRVFARGAKSAIHRALTAPRQTLLGHVAAGDRAAVRQCISRYGPLVWSLARRFAASEVEAEDAAREIFVALWSHAARFDPAVVSEPVFITMVARRCMIERLRQAAQRPALRPAPDSLASSEQHTEFERCAEARTAAGVLATLEPRQRRVLSLAIGQGMTFAEVAEITGVPIKEVKLLVRRALVAVRKRLQGAP
jgi:RNA polymerase sigma-70 factor (ECF subfamily)